ncbi:heme exporter protein CcmD [Salinicola halophilus]|uniref:heme exporter protein CcmD n=1 Tax=Salinicola halophilus TaxID=184065 RepID=UPI000DA17A3A|nr:heme exporter protein CcmD [Salinicola halophilus]
MAFDSLADFFSMHGYAPYVWSAWGLAALLLGGSLLFARGERQRTRAQIRRRQRQAGGGERQTSVAFRGAGE